jgi:hypothetical protein
MRSIPVLMSGTNGTCAFGRMRLKGSIKEHKNTK